MTNRILLTFYKIHIYLVNSNHIQVLFGNTHTTNKYNKNRLIYSVIQNSI